GTLTGEISGAGHADFEQLVVKALELDCSGATDAKFGGSIDSVKLDVSGASHVSGAKAGKLDVDAKGSSSVEFDVNGPVNAEASGASSIKVGPNAKIESKKTSGASSIHNN